jgi:TldD protein
MPGLDPFQVPIEEKIEFIQALNSVFHDRPRRGHFIRLASGGDITLYRQERALATTEGTYVAQTVYRTGGEVAAWVRSSDPKISGPQVYAQGLTLAGAGWDLFRSAKLEDQLPNLAEQSAALIDVGKKPVEIGKYYLVCDAPTMARLVDATLGRATQLDRVMGYEANAGGTSYLGPDPLSMLGTFNFGSPLLTVTADRTMSRGLATVQWDAEGVSPTTAPLVTAGVLQDYQTTREQAPWLAAWYQRQNQPVHSHGYAGAESALHITQQCTPNLAMAPGKEDIGFDELVAQTKRGIAVMDGSASTDFQSRAGAGTGVMREISNGKLGDILQFAGFLFDSVQLWKELAVIGGPKSTAMIAASDEKGEPSQSTMYSVEAVPGIIKNMSIIDTTRKA